MRILRIGLLCFLACGRTSTAQSDRFQPDTPPSLVAKVDQAKQKQLDGHDLDKAAAELLEVLAQKPNYYRALFNLGLIYQSQGKTEEALQKLTQAKLVRDQNHISDPSILNTLGWAYLDAGKLDLAEQSLLAALKEQPENSTANERVLNNLGYLYLQKGDTQKAKTYLHKSLDAYHSQGAMKVLKLVDDFEQTQAQSVKEIPNLISQIDVDNPQIRLKAVNALAFSSRYASAAVIDAVIQRLQHRDSPTLSVQGRINCETILGRRSSGSWTNEQLNDAKNIVADLGKGELSAPEKYTLDELKRTLQTVSITETAPPPIN
jgi:Tfp pilus assembly protein PilF